MNKRFYILMFLTLSLTIVILSASYAKDSGVSSFHNNKINNNNIIVNFEDNQYVSVYNVSKIDNYKNIDGYRFNVLNKNESSIKYNIEVICDDCINKIYYSINDSKPELIKNNIIYSSTIEKYGQEGDLDEYLVKFISLNNKYDEDIKINVIEDNNSLENYLLRNDSIKLIDKDYIFYGENNYIKYNNIEYRIIGIIDNKIMLFNTKNNKVIYNDNNEYLSEDLLLKIYDIKDINDIEGKTSWLDSYGDIWLKDNKEFVSRKIEDAVGISNESVVTLIDSSLDVLSGNGSKDEPYEVKYEG